MLYTKDGSRPAPLPHRLHMPDGTTRTDSSTFTEEEIELAGYVIADKMPAATYPNKVLWIDGAWVIQEPTQSDIYAKKQALKDACLDRLADTDYKVIKAVELGEPLDPVYVDYRQALREFYNTVDTLDPWTATLPYPIFPQEPEVVEETEEPVTE